MRLSNSLSQVSYPASLVVGLQLGLVGEVDVELLHVLGGRERLAACDVVDEQRVGVGEGEHRGERVRELGLS